MPRLSRWPVRFVRAAESRVAGTGGAALRIVRPRLEARRAVGAGRSRGRRLVGSWRSHWPEGKAVTGKAQRIILGLEVRRQP